MTLKPSHAAKRARTRYGVDMDELDEFEITSRIERGEAKRLHRTDNVAIYAVYWPKLGRTIPPTKPSAASSSPFSQSAGSHRALATTRAKPKSRLNSTLTSTRSRSKTPRSLSLETAQTR